MKMPNPKPYAPTQGALMPILWTKWCWKCWQSHWLPPRHQPPLSREGFMMQLPHHRCASTCSAHWFADISTAHPCPTIAMRGLASMR
jgi:hypothetical protein